MNFELFNNIFAFLFYFHLILPTFNLELSLLKQGYKYIAGVDEAGRGAWAGPIVGAAVILPVDFNLRGWPVRDSKTLSAKKRQELFKIITQKALSWQTCAVSNNEIDRFGLSWANAKVLIESAEHLSIKPDYLLIDAAPLKIKTAITYRPVTRGDRDVASIAAASIVAKFTRDKLMIKLAQEFSDYGFDRHKGYGTKLHQLQLKKFGICRIHRKSYKPIKKLLC